jgi:hypothetical protein
MTREEAVALLREAISVISDRLAKQMENHDNHIEKLLRSNNEHQKHLEELYKENRQLFETLSRHEEGFRKALGNDS